MKDDLKSFYTAVILSLAIIFLTNYIFGKKQPAVEAQPQPAVVQKAEPTATEENKSDAQQTVEEVLQSSKRIEIDNGAIRGSIRVAGGRIDNLWLSKYKQTLSPNSPDVELFAPAKTANPYYAEFGWLASDNSLKLPDANTVWNTKGNKLTPETPVVLEWDNGQGLRFITKISLDNNYMFSIDQSVENNTNKNITLFPYGLIARAQERVGSASVVHEGLIGVFNDKLEEIKYTDLKNNNKTFETTDGWLGFTDRYWFSAIILNNQQAADIKFSRNNTLYQADFVGAPINIAAGSVGNTQEKLYAGAKEIKLLDSYTDKLNIQKFDLAVDFGWYYFLTKPFFYILDYLYKLIGNMGWAILLFAALLRLAMFPIANKSYENMAKMKKLQPKMKELQEKFAEDKVKLQQETVLLYKKEKINPASGCLPMFIQIPVFFSLYKVLNIAIEIRHAPFVGWIKDLSAPDPMVLSEWTHIPFPSVLNIGIWPIVMGLTMFIQQKMSPAPTNKDQARAFALLPLIFTFMMGHFAAGLVIYWSFSNLLSIIQQRAIRLKNK
uniref:Membrane protein insertase YidC n=1 Tax=uncultured Alphaproteobacteria bacterium TaxID=91750 RepID=A0A6M4NNG8_9PROT|nr:membrane protein insertase YidC [uncultured Alphaproteobacteria bacterium]